MSDQQLRNSNSTNYFTRTRPMPKKTVKRKRQAPLYCEVMGQCTRCTDTFTVTIFLVHDQPIVEENARLKWVPLVIVEGIEEQHYSFERVLTHRPGECNGRVKLYGSIEKLYNRTTW